MNINDPLSPIRLQLMWDRLIAVVEEQALALIRTGFSTSTREAGDLSAGVFDLTGAMLAQAVTGTPGHINSMARAVRHFLDKFPARTMKEGDIFLTNDPWKGTGHLHDFTFVTPTFRRGRMVALFASTCHVVDIGGRGMTTDARNVHEEGLYVPLMRFAHAGKVDQTLIDIVTANVREPVQVVGDLYSLATCNEIGCRRLIEMMDEFAIDDLDRLGGHILEKSRQASLEAIRKIKPGEYKFSMRVDGYDKPIDLVATMKIGPTGIDVDFAGTSGVSAYGINVPVCYTEA
jgi:N-methylhydantoinase B